MRTEKKNFSIGDIVDAISGTIYSMAPRNRPRELGKIMSYVVDKLEAVCVDSLGGRNLWMDDAEFQKWIKDTLMGCPEFVNLNLTQNEVDNSISVDDESRAGFKLTSAYDVETEDSWKDDFIDLDAAISNITNRIYELHEPTDCFLCSHKDNKIICTQCKLNYPNRYFYKNAPYKSEKYAGWCKFSCGKCVAVCCKDCDEYSTCNREEKCVPTEGICPQYIVNSKYRGTQAAE